MSSNRLFLSVSDNDLKKLDELSSDIGMNRSEYIRHIIRNQRLIIPASIKEKEMIRLISKIDTDLKVLALREELTDADKLFIVSGIDDIKKLLRERTTCAPVEHKLERSN